MCYRREPVDRHRGWPHATRSVWSRQGISADISPPLPADGGALRPEYTGYHLREEEQSSSLLPIVAQVENPQDRCGQNFIMKSLMLMLFVLLLGFT